MQGLHVSVPLLLLPLPLLSLLLLLLLLPLPEVKPNAQFVWPAVIKFSFIAFSRLLLSFQRKLAFISSHYFLFTVVFFILVFLSLFNYSFVLCVLRMIDWRLESVLCQEQDAYINKDVHVHGAARTGFFFFSWMAIILKNDARIARGRDKMIYGHCPWCGTHFSNRTLQQNCCHTTHREVADRHGTDGRTALYKISRALWSNTTPCRWRPLRVIQYNITHIRTTERKWDAIVDDRRSFFNIWPESQLAMHATPLNSLHRIRQQQTASAAAEVLKF